jgi:hypothetical protein
MRRKPIIIKKIGHGLNIRLPLPPQKGGRHIDKKKKLNKNICRGK